MSLFAGFWDFLDNNCAMNTYLFYGLIAVLIILLVVFFVLKNMRPRDDDE